VSSVVKIGGSFEEVTDFPGIVLLSVRGTHTTDAKAQPGVAQPSHTTLSLKLERIPHHKGKVARDLFLVDVDDEVKRILESIDAQLKGIGRRAVVRILSND